MFSSLSDSFGATRVVLEVGKLDDFSRVPPNLAAS